MNTMPVVVTNLSKVAGTVYSTIHETMVPRLEDLPYASSPPIQFTYRPSAALSAGKYTFSESPSVLVPERPLIANSVYYFRSFSVSVDVDEGDYLSNIIDIPVFQMYLLSTGKQILFREPLLISKYFQNFDYRLCWMTQREDDQLYASVNGVIQQGASLLGRAALKMSIIISAQEIVEQAFVDKFMKVQYPKGVHNG